MFGDVNLGAVFAVLAIIIPLGILILVSVFDLLANQETAEPVDEYSCSVIDKLDINEAREASLDILQRYGVRRDAKSEESWLKEMNANTSSVLSTFQLLTFDTWTRDLEFTDGMAYKQGDYIRIGSWGGGEGIFVKLQADDANIYIEVDVEQYSILAPSIFHYILKAKKESELAGQRERGIKRDRSN